MGLVAGIVVPHIIRFIATAIVAAFAAYAFPRIFYIIAPNFTITVMPGISKIVNKASDEEIDRAIKFLAGKDVVFLAKFIIDTARGILTNIAPKDIEAINNFFAQNPGAIDADKWEQLRGWVREEKLSGRLDGHISVPPPAGPPPGKPEPPGWIKALIAAGGIASIIASGLPQNLIELINQLPNPEEVINDLARHIEERLRGEVKETEDIEKITPEWTTQVISDVLRERGLLDRTSPETVRQTGESILDQIKRWAQENLVKRVEEVVREVRSIPEFLRGLIASQLDTIKNFLNSFESIFKPVLEELNNLMNQIVNKISELISTLTSTLEAIATQLGQITAQIMTSTQTITSTLTELLTNPRQALQTTLEFVMENLQTIVQLIGAGIGTGIITAIETTPPSEFDRQRERIRGALLASCQQIRENPLFATFMDVIAGPAEGEENPLFRFTSMIVDGFFIRQNILKILESVMIPIMEFVKQENWRRCPTNIVTPAEAVKALIMGHISYAQFRELMLRHGLDDTQQAIMLNNAEQLPAPGELLTYWNRKDRPTGFLELWLKRIGYKDESIDIFKELANQIPGVSDLIRFMVRDAFNEAVVQRWGYDEDFPEAILEWTRRQGLSDEWTRAYWRAHWQLPSPTQAQEMVHRGAITIEEYDTLLKVADYPPPVREAFKKILFNPLTRIDTQRAYELGAITLDRVYKAYRDLGYDDENARILTEYTRRLVERRKLTETSEQRRAVASALTRAYEKGLISRSELENELRALKFEDDLIPIIIQHSTLERKLRFLDDVEDVIKRAYVNGMWDETKAINEMRAAGFSDEVIQYKLNLWSIARRIRTEDGVVHREKDLTKQEIVSAYTEGIILEDDARNMLRNLGYDEDETRIILANARLRRARLATNAVIREIGSKYTRGLISRTQAMSALGMLGLPGTTINEYLRVWDVEIELQKATEAVTAG